MGAILFLVVRLGAGWRFARRLRASAVNADPALETIVSAVAVELNVRRVSVIITDAISAPALYGVLHPKLLFPPHLFEQLTPVEARLIIAHELGHCRYHDLLANSLLHFVRFVHWFNPMVWFAGMVAKSDCEIAF
jgi:beta-lactamase regulating signal transducer with metallopeptidase domain